jgi:hypothetical protein
MASEYFVRRHDVIRGRLESSMWLPVFSDDVFLPLRQHIVKNVVHFLPKIGDSDYFSIDYHKTSRQKWVLLPEKIKPHLSA